MMFDVFSTKIQGIFNKLRKKGLLTKDDVSATMRELRVVLLEADVNFKVAKEFIGKISEKAVGAEILKSLDPAQHVIKIVKDELIEILGGDIPQVKIESVKSILLLGLQGCGKTTTTAKLAYKMVQKKRRPLLVGADPYRPAAKEQLQILGKKINVPVFVEGKTVIETLEGSLAYAKEHKCDCIIVDSAGRLQIDALMMNELKLLKQRLNPEECLLVVDGMTGQEAVNIASTFEKEIGISGIILTKLDGDARGGAALSIKMVTGKPIKFMGVGENIEQLEPFYPERMAQRILGMGDVLSLIEKAEESVNSEEAKSLQQRMLSQKFNLEDFLSQLKQIKKLGPLDQLMGMVPGFNKMSGGMKVNEKQLGRTEAIINSMTRLERKKPDILNGSRRKRIAKGSGTTVEEVNQLLKQFEQLKNMFGSLTKQGNKSNMLRGMSGGVPGFRR
ncbi:signal recognition particle protein [Candidatus Desantisbacteria bacterium CG2_30_40_21]|uniref:Signal recognition particle protein n=5 Tax=unclassified Candidatus Desantisiibacteriota TaxID=3106372 RepID=A0A2M7JD02_9BACT|nr:MAG: signal recognition particle protein [Candidatus Desantisbacteria bacterium CG2_30_40_21]PIP42119.1 MAG: signal recognition particle protein [Candidatus Desantisbacteria bacterium CG23_combo_of_CG06-09_8_20_14_all_40_23]PIX17300.1 MAG: signal recognition particle protein [Candidatus Desantisbacteria bacterium CG_4_8_14_3_um_filter_40_12]PIY20077.1 MAG: signal recognition particle protein [Candidatus Desantisbacteria bacterium CG_4_10_14_3_um_filter_40_18]PJB29257.1 MAG: signal recognitio